MRKDVNGNEFIVYILKFPTYVKWRYWAMRKDVDGSEFIVDILRIPTYFPYVGKRSCNLWTMCSGY